MAAYEREILLNEQSQFTDDVCLFEQYQQCLSAKFTDLIKALITADERAKTSVQQLLTSKDLTIQDLQQQLEDAKKARRLMLICLVMQPRKKKRWRRNWSRRDLL